MDKLFLNFFLIRLRDYYLFQLHKIFLVFFNNADVKFPVPGPTSRIDLFSILTMFAILSIIFGSTKKF